MRFNALEKSYVMNDEMEDRQGYLDAYGAHNHAVIHGSLEENEGLNGNCQTRQSSSPNELDEQELQNQNQISSSPSEDDDELNNGEDNNLGEPDFTKPDEEHGDDVFYNEDEQEPSPIEKERDENGDGAAYDDSRRTLKRKSMASILTPTSGEPSKKTKKKSNNVWNAKTSKKGGKKNKVTSNNVAISKDLAFITAVHRVPDKADDSSNMKICLSKVNKAERIELSEDRLTAGSTKGYRMVRATRGVVDGAWYFEIKIVYLGATGHTRLGWCTEKSDIQAPVGYDRNSYGYRDVDGSKVHKAVREPYGDGPYAEGDVIGIYISLPDGAKYVPDPPQYAYYKGQLHSVSSTNSTSEEEPQVVPGSKIMFYKNGVCQGAAFQDLTGGKYYPAASMYTLPNEPSCKVTFNFGTTFEFFPEDFGDNPKPRAMYEAPFSGFDGKPIQQGESDDAKSQSLQMKL
eukprot:TRINITY_DN1490_c0_g1_i3.p1 TRINITY_DN1490_c0_g1~~TRINITY_DN1490_c0_g1_i3.p1  ORF type:complete len:458 (+),score=105.75 TRINITY_DN1490_c0_g1_i3:132-1505(+)